VAASLVRDHNIPVFAIKGEDNETTTATPRRIDTSPRSPWTTARPRDLASTPAARTARRRNRRTEKPTGVIRLRAMAKKACCVPHYRGQRRRHQDLFDNRYARPIHNDGIIRATNYLLAGQSSWCRLRLVRTRPGQPARGAGAEVIVTEVDRQKASRHTWTASA